jgi:hypothetical protein
MLCQHVPEIGEPSRGYNQAVLRSAGQQQIKKCSRFLIRMINGIGSSIDRDRMRTISRHLGVCLPMEMTSWV